MNALLVQVLELVDGQERELPGAGRALERFIPVLSQVDVIEVDGRRLRVKAKRFVLEVLGLQILVEEPPGARAARERAASLKSLEERTSGEQELRKLHVQKEALRRVSDLVKSCHDCAPADVAAILLWCPKCWHERRRR